MSRKEKRAVIRLVKWTAIVLASLLMFAALKETAFRERGYIARGGEYVFLLFPILYYIASRTIKDVVAEAVRLFAPRRIKRRVTR